MLKFLYGFLFAASIVIFIVIFASNAVMSSSYYFYFFDKSFPATIILILTYLVGIATGAFFVLFLKALFTKNQASDEFDL